MAAAVVLFLSLFLPWFTTSDTNPNSTLGNGHRRRRQRERLAGLLDARPPARGRLQRAVHPRLDHRARAQADLEAGRGHDGRRDDRLRADPLQRRSSSAGPATAWTSGSGSATSSACSRPPGMWRRATCARRSTRTAQAPGRDLDMAIARSRLDGAPDRNLAMELVRTTEYAALACARWIGRGEKESADGAAVDAMRLMLDTVSMDGRVVIGEGEKDEAPMLYNGEQIGDGSPPAGGHRRRPARGHRALRQGPAQRDRHHRPVGAGHDVRPRALRLHAEDGHLARHGRTCSTSTGRCRETLELMAKEQGRGGGRHRGDHARPARGTRTRWPRSAARARASG